MKYFLQMTGAAVLVCALAACNPPSDLSPNIRIKGHSLIEENITVDDGRIGAKAADGSMAWVDPTGALEIDGHSVTLSAAQRSLAMQYHAEAMGVQDDAIAMGKAGVAMASRTVKSVVKGLMGGNPDGIGSEVETEASQIEDKAMLLCQRIGKLKAAQDALAVSLPAFAPHATMEAPEADACESRSTGRNDREPRTSDKALLAAVDAGDIDAVRRLVEQGTDINTRFRGDGTALIRAAGRGEIVIVDELLRLGADVNQSSRGDGNPLIAAAMAGQTAVVERLITAGADVDAIVAGDETALINAARSGHLDTVKVLADRGADVNLGVRADMGRWRSPLNQARDAAVRDYLVARGAVEK